MFFTAFETEMKTFLHCSGNSSNKTYSCQILKLQQNPLVQVNNNQWWCYKYSKFYVTPQKKNCMKYGLYDINGIRNLAKFRSV